MTLPDVQALADGFRLGKVADRGIAERRELRGGDVGRGDARNPHDGVTYSLRLAGLRVTDITVPGLTGVQYTPKTYRFGQ